jgi:serine/threonine protein kinase
MNFNLSQIKFILSELLLGLQHMHSQNILHRDLKSGNIFYKNDGSVVLADFGLSKRCSRDRNTGLVVTLWYRAPELLLGMLWLFKAIRSIRARLIFGPLGNFIFCKYNRIFVFYLFILIFILF